MRVLDFGVDDNTPFLVMEYAPNGTLRLRHPRGVPVPIEVVVPYVQQVAAALQYAHDQKLIHRDIKPENVLLGRNNEVLLSDFGIAVVTQSARAQSQISWDQAGTAAYMAPEQIQGKVVPASDQYGLAIVVYEWLTGMVPFSGTYMEVVSQQVSAPSPSLREKFPAISPDVEQVVLTALSKDPQRRFGRIQAFAKALEQAAQTKTTFPLPVVPSSNISTQNKLSEALTMEASLIGPKGRIALGPARLTIGQAADNNLVVRDGKVSSHHAEIRPEGQYYSIVDLGSTNKTFVNEQPLYSGVPRPLQQGDKLLFGDTMFTYEIVGSFQDKGAAPQERTVFASPGEVFPNYGSSNTGYGGGGAVYSGAEQQEYLETLPSHQPSHIPPPGQSPSHTPTPSSPSHMASNQQSYYGAPTANVGGGQQPLYTPPQQPQYTPQPPQPARKRSPMLAIILVVAALLVILGGAGTFLVINNNNIKTQHDNATATAIANNNAAATANVITTAHTIATRNAIATAQVTSHYPPFTTLAFNDQLTSSDSQWDSGSSCQFTSAGYQASIAQLNYFQSCLDSKVFGESAYQANMTIGQGDCGGLVFRYVDSKNFYLFEVCQNGTYNVGNYVKDQPTLLYPYPNFKASSAIHQGLNQQNVIAVVVQGDTVNMYVNGKNIDTAKNQNLTNAFSQGQIGLLAADTGDPTSVVYTNVLVWTAS